MNGRIKKINFEGRYGFIKADGGEEYFFHQSSLVNPLDWEEIAESRLVTFEPTETNKGKRAENVMVL